MELDDVEEENDDIGGGHNEDDGFVFLWFLLNFDCTDYGVHFNLCSFDFEIWIIILCLNFYNIIFYYLWTYKIF